MIYVDDRIGSNDLAKPLSRLGAPAQILRLEFADAAFVGQGPGGTPYQIGIEVKNVKDMMACITSGRFAGHQVPGLCRDYDEVWFIIEGEWRAGPQGLLEVRDNPKWGWYQYRSGRQGWMYRTVLEWLLTMTRATAQGGSLLMPWRSRDREDTIQFIAAQYHWWCDGPYERHKSLKTFVDYKGRVVASPGEPRDALMRRPTLLRRMLKELPGLGWDRSAEMEAHFHGDVSAFGQALVNVKTHPTLADRDWLVPKVIADKGAAKIVDAIRHNKS